MLLNLYSVYAVFKGHSEIQKKQKPFFTTVLQIKSEEFCSYSKIEAKVIILNLPEVYKLVDR